MNPGTGVEIREGLVEKEDLRRAGRSPTQCYPDGWPPEAAAASGEQVFDVEAAGPLHGHGLEWWRRLLPELQREGEVVRTVR